MKKQNQLIKILYLSNEHTAIHKIIFLLNKSTLLYDIKVCNSKTEYEKELKEFEPALILSDYTSQSFNPLNILKQYGLIIPFIVIVEIADEDFALAQMENGASDYFISNNLKRLPFAVFNAIKKNEGEKTGQKIKENEVKYRSFFENSMDGLLLTITDGNILAANPAACAMFQMTEEEICKAGRFGIVDLTDERLIPLIEERQRKGKVKGEVTFLKKDGSKFSGEISSTVFNDANGKERTSMIIRDISEHKSAELERAKITNDLIQRSKKLEQFTYIVSHNLRAPIANILGLSNVLKSTISDDERTKIQQYLFVAVDQLDEIIKDLNKILQVKTEIAENKELVYFPQLVSDIQLSIQTFIEKENVNIVTDFTIIDNAKIIKSYIHSVFYNLISNSVKYRQTNEVLNIKIKSKINNEKLIISFKDNGSGIDLKQHGDKIFGLYKRFHPHIEGKGLGLFMTKTQIEILGGTIQVKSVPNIETEFIIELPL